MWIVELALRRPHTFVVMAITIVIFGILSITGMAVDIFPVINIPVVSCVYTYVGMSPYEMENLVTTVVERALTSTVNGIQRMESTSLASMSVIKVYLQQGTNVGQSVAMVTSVGTALLRQLPRGISAPFVVSSSATDVPVVQLVLRSDTLSEAKLFDLANNLVRSQLATIQGATIPFPYGGKYRQVMVDVDNKALAAFGLSSWDVVEALNNQNVINPCGTVKMAEYEYIVTLNDSPKTIDELNALPIKAEKGTVIFVRDVAQVHDGNQPQLNIVNLNGHRAVLFNILKNGKASTLSVVQGIKQALPRIRTLVPPACHIDILTDQSIFVRECVDEVLREAATAAALTALMMLALLGSWRSTLIVATSIPLAILTAIIALNVMGQTINSMTLGGLALAVGMLVDDATVEIENVHRNMSMGKDIERAILDGAQQVALPALVSTMSICIVFVPVLLLTEPSRSLFVPLGMSVVLAMMASYGLSRTVVPLMSKKLLGAEQHSKGVAAEPGQPHKRSSFFGAIHNFIDGGFESARHGYRGLLESALQHRRVTVLCFLGFYVLSFCLLPHIGMDYFPAIDAGELRLHVCAHPGTRVEETERIFKMVETEIKGLLYPGDLESITDNIGLPVNGINYAFSDSQTVSEADGEILISLKEHRHGNTAAYQRQMRRVLAEKFPQCTFYFQPADIVTQILNAGLPAPIDIKVAGFDRLGNYKIALVLKRQVEKVPGIVDVCLHQVTDAPHIRWDVDRVRSREIGITQEQISNPFLTTLSSSWQTAPNFWLDRSSGINYNLAVQVPQDKLTTLGQMYNMPVAAPKTMLDSATSSPLLSNLAWGTRSHSPSVVSHINVMPVYDIYAACQFRDLGGVAGDLKKIIATAQPKLPHGVFLRMVGQVMSMMLAFAFLLGGLVFALVLVYLLLVVNFQSWTDPIIILMAIPGAFSGIMWSLFVTQTTFSIPALMGAIMTVGVASANSILMVTFANEQREEGYDAVTSALNAGYQRFRPVIMTATAMIIGMIPMAIGAGQGGSQNAPIGRAVIGGLLVATFSTLLFVPIMFSMMTRKQPLPQTDIAQAKSQEGGNVDR